jgi:hypothetical protein
MACRRSFIATSLLLLMTCASGCCWNSEVPVSQRQSYRTDLMGRMRSEAIRYLQNKGFESIAYTGEHVLKAGRYTGFCYWTISRYFYWIQLVFSIEDERVDQVNDGYGSRGP